MKTKNINYTQKLLAVLIIAVSLVAIAWLNPTQARAKKTSRKAPAPVLTKISRTLLGDTTKPKTNVRTEEENAEDIDQEAMTAEAKAAAAEAMANIDWEEINNEVSTAMKEVNWEDINREVENAMKNVDWKQINKDIETAMKNVDWNQMNKDVDNAMKNINWKQINKDIRANANGDANVNIDTNGIQESIRMGMDAARSAMKDVAIPAAQMGMEAARNAMNSQEVKEAIRKGMEEGRIQSQKAMQEARQEMALAMANAKVEMKKQKEAMQQQRIAMVKQREDMAHAKADGKYREMLDKMAADKLIDAEKGYKIEKKDGDLYINDVKQSADVADKYKTYLKAAKKLSILGKEDNLSISVEE